MSEYQCIAFRAIDGPVSPKQLEFMRKQSSRAEITPWAFDNEYQYSDFRGNAEEMLRRGYDFHLHYANFGVRKLMFRLPAGLPDAAQPYLLGEDLAFLKDKDGAGGILVIEPGNEAGELEDIFELDELIDRLLPLRAEILQGDLRPFYLAYLAVAQDMNHDPAEEKEPPVPAGLTQLTDAQLALAELYELDEGLLAAAAQKSPPLPERAKAESQYLAWLQTQPEATKNAWLAEFLAEPNTAVRRDILAAYQKSQGLPAWPTVPSERSIADLRAAGATAAEELRHKKAKEAARQRAKKLSDMAADPQRHLKEIDKLVKERSTDSYEKIARLLSDLREALAGSPQASLAEQHAQKLKKSHPTLKMLTSALRKQGFLTR